MAQHIKLTFAMSLLASFGMLFILSGKVHAATLNVVAGTDGIEENSQCQLSEAIQNINDQAQTNTDCPAGDGTDDTINLPSGTITLTQDLAEFTKSFTVQGLGQETSIVDGEGQYRAFNVSGGSAPTMNVELDGIGFDGTSAFVGLMNSALLSARLTNLKMVDSIVVQGEFQPQYNTLTVSAADAYVSNIEATGGNCNIQIFYANYFGADSLPLPENYELSNVHLHNCEIALAAISITDSIGGFTPLYDAPFNAVMRDVVVEDNDRASVGGQINTYSQSGATVLFEDIVVDNNQKVFTPEDMNSIDFTLLNGLALFTNDFVDATVRNITVTNNQLSLNGTLEPLNFNDGFENQKIGFVSGLMLINERVNQTNLGYGFMELWGIPEGLLNPEEMQFNPSNPKKIKASNLTISNNSASTTDNSNQSYAISGLFTQGIQYNFDYKISNLSASSTSMINTPSLITLNNTSANNNNLYNCTPSSRMIFPFFTGALGFSSMAYIHLIFDSAITGQPASFDLLPSRLGFQSQTGITSNDDSCVLPASSDSDPISDSVENASPNNGDGNNDGTPDSEQANVTSLPIPSGSNQGTYVTLVTPSGTTITTTAIEQATSLATQDSSFDYPLGLISFTATDLSPGSTIPIELYYYTDQSPDTFTPRKYNPNTTAYTTLSTQTNTTLTQTTINTTKALKLTYQITDGGDLDQDNTINGTIVDPVGLAQTKTTAPDTGLGKYWLLGVKN